MAAAHDVSRPARRWSRRTASPLCNKSEHSDGLKRTELVVTWQHRTENPDFCSNSSSGDGVLGGAMARTVRTNHGPDDDRAGRTRAMRRSARSPSDAARRGAAGLRKPRPAGRTATATSAASGRPAANAVDGSATTTWCATQWTGTVVVDLGAERALDSIGVTLGATAFPSTVAISLRTETGSSQPVPSAQNIALNANTPSYVALPRVQAARFAEVTVTTGDGSPACVGEIRLFGEHQATDRDDARRRPVLHAAGGGRRHPIHRCREAIRPGADPPRPRRQLRADASVAGPAAGLQRPDQQPGAGPSGEGRRHEGVPRHPLLRLLGRSTAPGHPRRLAGPGPGNAVGHGAHLHPRRHRRLRPPADAGRHGLDRQRDPQRHAVADRPDQLEPPTPAGTTWRRCSGPESRVRTAPTREVTNFA